MRSLSKHGFRSIDDVQKLRDAFENGVFDAAEHKLTNAEMIEGFDNVLDYMRGQRATGEATASVRETRRAREAERAAAASMSPAALALDRIRGYFRSGAKDVAGWRDIPISEDTVEGRKLRKALGDLLTDDDGAPLSGKPLAEALESELPTAARLVLRAAYAASRDAAGNASPGVKADARAWTAEGLGRDFFESNFSVWSNGKWKPELSKAEIEKVLFPAEASRKGEDIVDGAPLCTV